VKAIDSPLARGLGMSFEVEDAPYFIELQDPGSTQIRLKITARGNLTPSSRGCAAIGWGVSACSRERTTPPQM